jgi:hypothetical protein
MKKLLFAVLFGAACGGTYKQSANAAASEVVAECTYAMSDDSSAEDIQKAVADAESGDLDPCAGQLSDDAKVGLHAVLDSIDPDTVDHLILIRFQMWKGRIPLNTP